MKLSSYLTRIVYIRDRAEYHAGEVFMKDLARSLFSDDDDLAISSDDEIDQLFLQLEQIQPPPTLVDSILASVARLPRQEFLADVEDEDEASWNEYGAVVVPPSHLQPS